MCLSFVCASHLYFLLDYYYNPLWGSRNRELVAVFLGAPMGQRKNPAAAE
jgi:hypothetical protein